MTNNNFHANLLKEISQINLSREQIKALNKLNIFEKVDPATIELISNNIKMFLGEETPKLPTSCPYCDSPLINSINGQNNKIEIPSKDKKSMMIIYTHEFTCLRCKMKTPIWIGKEVITNEN